MLIISEFAALPKTVFYKLIHFHFFKKEVY